MKYEYIYELECDCEHNAFMTYGVQKEEIEVDRDFGNCMTCNLPYKKKKKIKRKIDSKTNKIIPDDKIEVFE